MKEPKVMKEIHKIREEMAKLPANIRKNLFKKASVKYKKLVSA